MNARWSVTLLALACSLAMPGAALAQLCGPVILAGHDADDHGFGVVYAGLFNELLANTSNGGSGFLVVGADPGGKSETWFRDVASFMAVPQSVTIVNDAAISTVDFSPYAIVAVPSDSLDTPGGISPAENSLLAARKADLADFGAAGGGIFGLTQGELVDAFAYIVDVALIDHSDAPPSGYLPSGSLFDDVSATPEGNILGIDDVNVDGCCFHNIFTLFPPFLRRLANANEPLDPGFDGQAVFIGGVNACLALPVLSVQFDWYSAERTEARVVVRWETLEERGTTGFTVLRADSPDAAAVAHEFSEFIAPLGPRREYRLIDPSPPRGAAWYFIQEHTISGAGDRSALLRVDAAASAPTGSSQRRRRGQHR